MKREIKFRAWHIELKQMFWFDLLWGNHNRGDGYIGMVKWGEEQSKHRHRDNMMLIDPTNCELMQYTGLKDKNGVEIYEGDIVKTEHLVIKTGIIEYWEVYHSFEITDIFRNGCISDKYDWSDIEVIGNVFKNPEILQP